MEKKRLLDNFGVKVGLSLLGLAALFLAICSIPKLFQKSWIKNSRCIKRELSPNKKIESFST